MSFNRTIPPEPNGEINFKLPKIDKFTLENGLEVISVKKKKLPILHLTLISNAGSKFDPNEKKGLSYLLTSLLDEGAGNLDAMQIADKIESLGSVLSLFSDQDSIFFSLLTLSENQEASLDIFSGIITSPHLTENDFLREKKKMLAKIIQSRDNPAYLAASIFENLVFGSENPYGLPEIGFERTVEKIENEDIRLFYNTLITPENSKLIVVGNFEKDEITDLLNEKFKNWHSYKPFIFEPPVVTAVPTQFYLVDKKDSPQSEVVLGHISKGRHTPDFFAKALMNAVLGGQFSSRINLNLREDKGYTYGATSSFSYNPHYGYFSAGCAVDSANTGNAITELIKELNGIREQIHDKELRFAKSSFTRKYPSLFETYGQIAKNLTNMVIYDLPDDYYDTYINKIKKVELEEVEAAARNNIFPDKLFVLAVGDKKTVLPQLKGISEGNIIELDYDANIRNVL
jgi:zinc protease